MRAVAACLLSIAACGDNLIGPVDELRVGTACPDLVMREVNDHWIETHSDPGDNKWARAVYFIGNTAAAEALDEPRYARYTRRWVDEHGAHINGGTGTHNADNHAAGQVYLTLYDQEDDPHLVEDIQRALDTIVDGGTRDDWSWIDAQFMAAPAFAHLGERTGDERYVTAMGELQLDARDRRHLYDEGEHLWYRDESFRFPGAKTPGGKKIFWSRGNGWVMGSLARVLEHLPPAGELRDRYAQLLVEMAAALALRQRDDGMWNVSLDDDNDFPGPEVSGTMFFTYGMAWGIRAGLLDAAAYGPIVERAWNGVVHGAIRSDGGLGYVQGVGEQPSSSQPVTLQWSEHDYGVGAFLLAGTEVRRLDLDFGCEVAP